MSNTATKRKVSAVDQLADTLDSGFFRALSEPARIDIIKVLMLNGCCDIGTIADHLPQDRSVISRHLNQMLEADLVTCIRDGRFRLYEINAKGFLSSSEQITEQIRQCIAECCPEENCCS